MEAHRHRLPMHLCGLLVAGVRTGRLAEVMEQFVAVERNRREALRRVASIMFYPSVLVLGLMCLMVFFSLVIAPGFRQMFFELGVDLPVLTQMVLLLAGPGVRVLIHGLVILAVLIYLAFMLPRPLWVRRLVYLLPLIGPMVRAAALVVFARFMKILLEQRVPLHQALRLVAMGVRDPAIAAGCREAASGVEAGGGLSDCMARHWAFPPTLLPVVRWGQYTSNMPEAFQAAAEMYEGRLRVSNTLLATIMPPLLLAIMAFGIGVLLLGLYLPLISLIQGLSGW
ncbi:MAG TPA: hypothetical protein EYP56_22545 [Planctomycetaceae bacterium]|nr:hypothetical protein [Planctomycetaceae bacterium]